MQTTTTINDFLQTQLQNAGLDEFVNTVDGMPQITMNDQRFTFISKIMQYDEDVQAIVTRDIFNNVAIHSSRKDADPVKDKQADIIFKKMFVNKFLDREIAQQTIEAFSAKVTYFTLAHMAEIYVLISQLEDYYDVQDTTNNLVTTDNSTKNGSNGGTANLPQDDVNLDLTADKMDYADINNVGRGFNDFHGTVQTTGSKLSDDPHVFEILKDVFDKNIFRPMDKQCFLQVF